MALERKLTCTTCGGELVADREKNIYKCSFCGVAYGYSLFDGSAAEKAAMALSIGEFNDADLYYTFVLTMNLSDITALRGRVFCAGKWMKTSDLMTGRGELTGVRADAVRSRCDEAMKKLYKDERVYFQLIKDFVDVSEKYHKVKIKARPVIEREKFLTKHSKEMDDRMFTMERSYEWHRSRNRTLADYVLGRPGSMPPSTALQDARDVSDIMHGAISDTQKEAMDFNRQIGNYTATREKLYKQIVEIEKHWRTKL